MPKYSVPIVRWFNSCDSTIVEIVAKNANDAKEKALALTGNDTLDWCEGDDYEITEYVVGDPEEE